MKSTAAAENRLAHCTSPYLKQHARNPVDWYPWGPEALERARAEDRPILLSVGYSACHWCHVMERESFEDEGVAAVMNAHFVNIKVDREERPDLDRIYQSAHQLLAQRPGGWPLTVFLTPNDRVPFFAGTYFPPRPRHGLPAFTDLLKHIDQAYREQQQTIREQNRSMLDALDAMNPRPTDDGADMDSGPLEVARRQLAQSFDAEHGGFGQPPKFPHPTNLTLLLRHWAGTRAQGQPDRQALHMAAFTLERMIEGGVNDQLGGGFCRYSVDKSWMIPHFEKMLYDNGPLLALCCDAWQATGRGLFRQAADATADWVMREMQAPDGGYYSSLDADSEGEEGRFYVWEPKQVRRLLSAEEFALLAARYSDAQKPNFEGKWHLHGYRSTEQLAEQFSLPEQDVRERLERARGKLFRERERRVRPGRDEKVLTAWNALMIQGMARAGRVLQRDDCLRSAERSLAFIRDRLWREGRLLATSKDGRSHLMAYLDDYAYLLSALLELLQARWDDDDLGFARELADSLLALFQAPQGGFFFTASDHEALIHRPMPLNDESTPSGNGVAAQALLRLGHLLGEIPYLEAAERCLGLAWPNLQQLPYAHTSLLAALDDWLYPGETLVIRAAREDRARWTAALPDGYAPKRQEYFIPDEADSAPGALDRYPAGNGGVAYLCRGTRCEAPLHGPEQLVTALRPAGQ
jgi:uncharacterized protein YyaL (SSP411 family)